MSEPIRFYKGEETGIVHENYNEKGTSLFKDQYDKALNEIGAYLSYYKTINEVNNESNDEDDDEQITKQNKSKKQSQYIELNNIFAFIGERGTGKTSCMKSVAGMLYKHRKNTNKNGCEKFLKIDPIDPTIFDDNTNLMQVVIGVMFEKFKEAVANSDNLPYNADRDTYEKNKQNLLKAFQDVKECIKYISNPDLLKCEDDDISQLAGMASVSKLNDKIGKLADRYLEFFDKNILVLQIDDIDLQTKYAYQMVEEIRKYFMHKNIIVLMAVKMEQLAKVIENETAKQYEPLKKLEGITLPEISDMAIRYLLKLIPINHRIYMPTAEVYVDRGLRYFTSREDELKYEGKTGDENKALLGDWTSVKYAITSLIYKKCRYLFYHSKGVTSPIVPTNLRELRHLFAMLCDMNDYRKKCPQIENKTRFLAYFYSTWVQNNIATGDLQIIKNIKDISDASAVNKTVVQLLKKKYETTIFSAGQFPEIFSERNVSYNVSIADAYTIIDYVGQRVESVEDRNLIFFIKSHYSILLYQYYDQITEKYQPYYEPSKIEDEFEKRVDSSIRRREKVDEFSDYETLIGGTFINTEEYPLLPKEQSTDIPRDRRAISYAALSNIANELCEVTNEIESLDANTCLALLWLVEFFALCTSRTIDSRSGVNKKSREHSDVGYTYRYDRKYDSLLFDLGAFFFNITNIKRAYNRINPQFFKLAEMTRNSLYNKLRAKCQNIRGWKEDRDDISEYALLSCACIRNFEVLFDFMNEIQYDWQDRSPSKGNIDNIIKIFNRVEDYNIHTYDKNDVEFDEKLYSENLKRRLSEPADVEEVINDELNKQVEQVAYKITFEYVGVVSDVLNRIKSLIVAEEDKEEKTIIQLKRVTFKLEELFDLVFCPTKENKVKHLAKKDIKLNTFDIDAIMAHLPNRDEFSLNTFLRRVRECCDPIFRNNAELPHKWYHLEIFEVERAGVKISRDKARNELIKFKNENNLL